MVYLKETARIIFQFVRTSKIFSLQYWIVAKNTGLTKNLQRKQSTALISVKIISKQFRIVQKLNCE